MIRVAEVAATLKGVQEVAKNMKSIGEFLNEAASHGKLEDVLKLNSQMIASCKYISENLQ